MRKVSLNRLIKKCTIYYGFFGLCLGIIIFIITLVNPTIPFHIGDKEVYGFAAGVLVLLFSPLIMSIVGFTHSFIIWYPISLLFSYIKYKSV